jgi:prepilin-type N-terminal cleavage/methylation domain-containing protein
VIKHKKQQIEPSSDESGFTLIESLVAIVVVAILMTAISPVIVLSTATRIQAKRIEQASIAARNFIDGVKTQTIKPEVIESGIPSIELEPAAPSPGTPRNISDNLVKLKTMPVPSDKTKLFCVDEDGKIQNPDCSTSINKNKFFIQATKVRVKNSQLNDGYRLAVRVYRKEAFDTSVALEASDADNTDENKKKITQKAFTGGLGSIKRPLVEMTSDIASDTTTFRSLCSRLGRADNKNCDS